MAGAITFTGLGSGIDMKSIIDGTLEVERLRYIQPMENWKAEWEAKVEAFQNLNTKLANLHSTVKSIDTTNEFYAKTASSSDESEVSATADSTAVNNSYKIEIGQLAAAEKEIHEGLTSEDTVVHTGGAAGSFDYTYAGTSVSISVVSGTTLTQLVNSINNDPSNPGVTASILDDGSGGATSHHLVLTGNDTGASNTIAVTSVPDQMNNNFDQTGAANAWFKIDDYPDGVGNYIERETNTISDLITGVTFTLKETHDIPSNESATVTIATDKTSTKQNIYDFVDAFNEVRTYIQEITKLDPTVAEANLTNGNDEVTPEDTENGILLGNYGVNTIKSRLDAIVTGSPSGFRDGSDTYINLMQIGIYTDVDQGSETQGLLIINETDLNEALSDNPDAVADLFASYFDGRAAGGTNSDKIEYVSYIDGITEPGTYEIDFNSSNPAQSRMRIAGGEWHTVFSWDVDTKTLTGAEGEAESGLVIKVTDDSSDFTDAFIDLKRGLAGDMNDELTFLTHSDDGPLAVLEDNYNTIINNINSKISYEENRIEILEMRLTAKYARLEATLTELNSQMNSLNSSIARLG